MVSLKDQLWIHDYDWESCNDRNCDKDQFLDKEDEVGGRLCASNFEVPGWKLNSKILYIFL